MNKEVLLQNQKSWNSMADTWFGTTALPVYGCLAPTEAQLQLFPDLGDKKILDIGCGSGHSLKWCGDNGASELWGIDISAKQIQNADKYLAENGYKATLSVSPMEEMETLPKNYFDVIYSIYALGWTVDLPKTIKNISYCLKREGTLIFSWDHPLMHCVTSREQKFFLEGCNYLSDEMVSFELRGNPVTIQSRKMSTWINTLAEENFKIEKVIEETSQDVLEKEYEFSESYYAPSRAKVMPLSFIVKATKM